MAIDGRQSVAVQSEERCLLWSRIVKKLIVAMQVHRSIQRILRPPNARHVIDMRVCQKDAADFERPSLGYVEQHIDFVARIDDYCLACGLAGDEVAVFLKGRNCARFDDHRRNIHHAAIAAASMTSTTIAMMPPRRDSRRR